MDDKPQALFELKKHDLGVADFAHSEDSRPMLQHVLARINDEKQIELCVTDSYVLIKHKPRDFVGEEFEPFLIPAKVLQRVNKLVTKGTKFKPAPVIEVYRDHINLLGIGVRIDFKPLDESTADKYPDIERVLRDAVKPTTDGNVKLNGRYIQKVCKFITTEENGGSIDITVGAKMAPTVFKTNLTYAVIMPLKG